MSPVSDKRKQSIAEYNLKAYDRVELKVHKGRKDELKAHAAKRGESLNGFINRAIKETEERDNQQEAK